MDPLEACHAALQEENVQTQVVKDSKEYAISHGFCVMSKSREPDSYTFLPFCLLPSRIPRSAIEQVKGLQEDINLLIHRVAHDYEFLRDCLKSTIETDKFTASIFNIYERVREAGFPQPLSLGLLRSDYLLDLKEAGSDPRKAVPKQVEVNTIASAIAGLLPILHRQHKHIMKTLGANLTDAQMPECVTDKRLSNGLLVAWKAYKNENLRPAACVQWAVRSTSDPKAVASSQLQWLHLVNAKDKAAILFVVEEVTSYVCDQRRLEYIISDVNAQARVMRRKFSELHDCTVKEGRLFVDGVEIAVVYYRTGYSPDQMDEKAWEVRLQMELSMAIKCPSSQYHLAGTKKVQQVLAQPGVLERFLSNKGTVDRVRATFTGLYSLDLTTDGNRAADEAIANPNDFVLKPQREGGGNNLYGEELRQHLKALGRTKQRESYILMDLIRSPTTTNYIVRPGEKVTARSVVSEIGIFGVILGDQNNIIENYEAGDMLKTKPADVSEGGISAGGAALDTAFLD